MEKKEFIVMRTITIVDGRRHVTSYTEKELIRCKRCKHKRENPYRCLHEHNTMGDDWFCAEGETESND